MRKIDQGIDPNNSVSFNAPVFEAAARPRLPQLVDGEDISSFLVRFERVAALLKTPEANFAVLLSTLLTGKALDIYAALSDEITGDYKLLKDALLKGFKKIPEGFRSEFRSAKPKLSDTYALFGIHLGRLLDYWLESLNAPKTYDGLRGFIFVDQFMAAVTPELRVRLKEENLFTLYILITFADNWTSAHLPFRKDSRNRNPNNKYYDNRKFIDTDDDCKGV